MYQLGASEEMVERMEVLSLKDERMVCEEKKKRMKQTRPGGCLVGSYLPFYRTLPMRKCHCRRALEGSCDIAGKERLSNLKKAL